LRIFTITLLAISIGLGWTLTSYAGSITPDLLKLDTRFENIKIEKLKFEKAQFPRLEVPRNAKPRVGKSPTLSANEELRNSFTRKSNGATKPSSTMITNTQLNRIHQRNGAKSLLSSTIKAISKALGYETARSEDKTRLNSKETAVTDEGRTVGTNRLIRNRSNDNLYGIGHKVDAGNIAQVSKKIDVSKLKIDVPKLRIKK